MDSTRRYIRDSWKRIFVVDQSKCDYKDRMRRQDIDIEMSVPSRFHFRLCVTHKQCDLIDGSLVESRGEQHNTRFRITAVGSRNSVKHVMQIGH